mmetsp:Transcript_61337/g.71386  ORF Transcript_61337/g.71386 Transcript_61337/m.71386 type:complete len:91 (+) Transcript_61337:350-622(+)
MPLPLTQRNRKAIHECERQNEHSDDEQDEEPSLKYAEHVPFHWNPRSFAVQIFGELEPPALQDRVCGVQASHNELPASASHDSHRTLFPF